jgi:hypothetical protein
VALIVHPSYVPEKVGINGKRCKLENDIPMRNNGIGSG